MNELRVYKTGFDGAAYEKKQPFGATFPCMVVPLAPELLTAYPKLREALEEMGRDLADQYAQVQVNEGPSRAVGVQLIGIDFNLILGKG